MKKKSLLLQSVKQMNRGAIFSGVGFLLYLAVRAIGWEAVADVICVLFAVVSIWTFCSVVQGRRRDKEAVSCNLLWGTGALALLMAGCVAAAIQLRLGT